MKQMLIIDINRTCSYYTEGSNGAIEQITSAEIDRSVMCDKLI